MTNALRTYSFLVHILLFSIFTFLFSGSPQNRSRNFFIKTSKSSFVRNHTPSAKGEALTLVHQLTIRKGSSKIYCEKNEEENLKLNFVRTYTIAGNYFTNFYTKISKTFAGQLIHSSPGILHWFYSSSHRFITLLVLRI